MTEKYIELLQQQINRLGDKDFDLDAWKNHTVVLLSRIFGKNDLKIKQIESIKYDFSSWSLRDTSGSGKETDHCRKMAKEILDTAISELKNFGTSGSTETTKESQILDDRILSALEDELKGSQFKELKKILSSGTDIAQKSSDLRSIFSQIDGQTLMNILVNILSKIEIR